MSTCAHCGIVRVHITLFFQCRVKSCLFDYVLRFTKQLYIKYLYSTGWTATAPKVAPWGSSLLSLRHLLLLSPRNTWKKPFYNILFSKFNSLAQETTRINFNFKPSLHTLSYAAVRSINTKPVLSLRWKPASISDVSAKTYSVQLHQSEVGFVEGSFAQVSWKRY
jgi:hypothetical protein